jgi:hypothetical protein
MWKQAREEIREILWLVLTIVGLSGLGIALAVASAMAFTG